MQCYQCPTKKRFRNLPQDCESTCERFPQLCKQFYTFWQFIAAYELFRSLLNSDLIVGLKSYGPKLSVTFLIDFERVSFIPWLTFILRSQYLSFPKRYSTFLETVEPDFGQRCFNTSCSFLYGLVVCFQTFYP